MSHDNLLTFYIEQSLTSKVIGNKNFKPVIKILQRLQILLNILNKEAIHV